MDKISLKRCVVPDWNPGGIVHLSAAKPFILNDRAVLIHRPRSAEIYWSGQKKQHMSVSNWCGSTFNRGKGLTFLSAPPVDRLVCAVCEERALMAGQKSSSELAGRHVCTGRLRAINTCCK